LKFEINPVQKIQRKTKKSKQDCRVCLFLLIENIT
jgi:hypothetical protein